MGPALSASVHRWLEHRADTQECLSLPSNPPRHLEVFVIVAAEQVVRHLIAGEGLGLIESRIISRHSKQREDCFQKAVIKRGLRCMRRSALRARSFSSP